MADGAGLGTSALIAVLLVPVVSLVKRPTWRKEVNYVVGMVAALISAFIGGLIDGEFTSVGFAAYLASAIAASQTIYTLYFGNTDLENKLAEK